MIIKPKNATKASFTRRCFLSIVSYAFTTLRTLNAGQPVKKVAVVVVDEVKGVLNHK